MSSENEAYAILVTRDIYQAQLDKKDLLLPLTLTYLLSEHIRFFFPMPEERARLVDATFDEILKGLFLKSKGVCYLKDYPVHQIQELLSGADLVLTTDDEIAQRAQGIALPHIFLCPGNNGKPAVKAQALAKIENEDLRIQALGSVQLISVLSSGVLSQGHFSLSW